MIFGLGAVSQGAGGGQRPSAQQTGRDDAPGGSKSSWAVLQEGFAGLEGTLDVPYCTGAQQVIEVRFTGSNARGLWAVLKKERTMGSTAQGPCQSLRRQ